MAGAAIIGVFLVTSIASGDHHRGRRDGSYGALLNVLALPLYLRDIVFLGHVDPTTPARRRRRTAGCSPPLLYVVVLAAGTGVLLWRYRWVER